MFPLIPNEPEHLKMGDEIDTQLRTWQKWQTISPANYSSPTTLKMEVVTSPET
jgi:hypothetical protein